MSHFALEEDLEKIKVLGELYREENFRFRKYLKGQNGRKIDKTVHRLNDEIAPKIDCVACGNCCRHLSPCIDEGDVERLSVGLGVDRDEVLAKHTETLEGELSLKFPCTFLKDNRCGIYAYRPETCASFPHLHKDGFVQRMYTVIENYSICPIVFNVVERLKQELQFS